jgi:8-oxo-dGTP diphosphatase
MAKERFKIPVFVALILRKNEKILLIRRSNTGSGDGFYSCAGGGVDGDETITQAMIREADEELGIKLKKENLKIVHIVHSKKRQDANENVGFFLEATEWDGELRNMEPHKHDDVSWFCLNNLPKNTFPRLIHVIKMVDEKVFYSEYGWD